VIDRRRLSRVPWDVVATAVPCIAWGTTTGHDRHLNVDHAVYLSTVHLMRRGSGYYAAMDRALRAFIGPAATPRAFRPPTIFFFWRLLPSDRVIWTVLVVLVGLASIGLGRVVRVRWIAPVLASYYLYNAWNKFTLVEMWGCVIVVGAVVAWTRGYRTLAVVLGTVAALVRETTLPFLAGGLIAAHRFKQRRWPWLLGLAISAAAFALESHAAGHYLVAHGTESPLLGTGRPPFSVARWMGFGLPLGPLVGPVLWVVAGLALLGELPRVKGPRRWVPPPGFDELLLPYLALPILGFLVTRDYWGVLVVPFTLALSAMVVDQQVRAFWQSRAATSTDSTDR
jgi:hypothetical protein